MGIDESEKRKTMYLDLTIQPASPHLPPHRSAQACYVLLEIAAPGAMAGRTRLVNLALVADASRSMRIPIISEEQFRQLVRAGSAHEVLVDGVPVWQFSGPTSSEIDINAPNALDYVVRALHSIVEHLDDADRFVLVACAADALLLAPGTRGAERALLAQQIGRLNDVPPGDATDLASGMRLGLDELLRGAGGLGRVERLLMLTDGFTRHPERCLDLARQAAARGISISTLGLGGDFQDELLTALADTSGGRAVFLRQAEDIPQAVARELAAARAVAARAVGLTSTLSAGVALRRATSISPTLALLEPGTSGEPGPATSSTLHLGDLEQQTPVRVLLELLVPPLPLPEDQTMRRVRLAQVQVTSEGVAAAQLDLVATCTRAPLPAAPADVLRAAALANAARLQRRALDAAASGDRATGAKLLRTVATRLSELGEGALANMALQEATALEQTGQTTRLGAKELTYATRRLGRE